MQIIARLPTGMRRSGALFLAIYVSAFISLCYISTVRAITSDPREMVANTKTLVDKLEFVDDRHLLADSCAVLDREGASCASCTLSGCHWCAEAGCFSKHLSIDAIKCPSSSEVRTYDDECPLERKDTEDDVDDFDSGFLAGWIGSMLPAIGNLTLLDLTLPGTHDSFTHDLSTVVSDGGADDMIVLAEILHKFNRIVPDGVEDFIRQQSVTQKLNVTAQLDNGVRFIDLRMMLEYSDKVHPEWHSLHFMQSIDTSMAYFTQIRDWMAEHPTELVVLWLSKHGNTCATGEDQYPNVSIEEKQAFWQKITDCFEGMLTDFTKTRVNETTVAEMIERNHRVVIYASDYVEFTGGESAELGRFALDGCLVDNHCGPSVSTEEEALAWERGEYASAKDTKARDKQTRRLYLQSLASGQPTTQIEMAAKIKWLPYSEEDVAKCAAEFAVPGLDSWCPQTLMDISQLENYYKQISLSEVLPEVDAALSSPTSASASSWGFPNAIYINAVDWDGTIRTGTQLLWGTQRADSDAEHQTTAFAYVDTLLAYNQRVACGSSTVGVCGTLRTQLEKRMRKNPASYWEDPLYGRLVDWPK